VLGPFFPTSRDLSFFLSILQSLSIFRLSRLRPSCASVSRSSFGASLTHFYYHPLKVLSSSNSFSTFYIFLDKVSPPFCYAAGEPQVVSAENFLFSPLRFAWFSLNTESFLPRSERVTVPPPFPFFKWVLDGSYLFSFCGIEGASPATLRLRTPPARRIVFEQMSRNHVCPLPLSTGFSLQFYVSFSLIVGIWFSFFFELFLPEALLPALRPIPL